MRCIRRGREFLQIAPIVAILAVLSSATVAFAGHGKSGPSYDIRAFEPPGSDAARTKVNDVNGVGEVVGVSTPNPISIWWHLDLATGDYTPLPGNVTGINNHGHMVGQTSDGVALFLSSVTADTVPLPPLAGDDQSIARDINDDGLIVGYSKIGGTDPTTGVVWRAVIGSDGTVSITGPVPLAPLDGDANTFAERVSDPLSGPVLVLGGSRPKDSNAREAVVWSLAVDGNGALVVGAPTGLGTLGLLDPPDVSYSEAYGINGFGDVCGQSDLLPFLVPAGGAMEPLPVPSDTWQAWARDVNDLGEVVGHYYVEKVSGARIQTLEYPFLWSEANGPVDLNTFLNDRNWDQLWHAYRITGAGAISGLGSYNGAERGFIMTPK